MGRGHVLQQLIIAEVARQPEPLLREVWHYLSFLKSNAEAAKRQDVSVCPGYGSVPGIALADDFDAPLDDVSPV